MTTNYQRAYDIIAEGIAAEDHPGDITQRLHTAGGPPPRPPPLGGAYRQSTGLST